MGEQASDRANEVRVAVDGMFGDHTETAVIHFQNGFRLIADGVVGSLTWDALRR